MNGRAHEADAARTLWTGGFRSGLEDALLSHLARRRRDEPLAPLTVAVPTNLLRQHLSRRLAEETGGHVGVRFATLKDLAADAVGPAFLAERSPLPRGAQEVVLRRLIERGLLAGGYFDAVSDRPGIPGVLQRALRTLREGGFTLESFERTAARARLLGGGRRSKLAELLRVWRALDSELSGKGWYDDLDLMEEAVRALEGDSLAEPPVVYGFYDLNALQRRLVRAALGDAPANVFVPWEDVEACRYAERVVEWLESLGFERRDVAQEKRPRLPLPGKTRLLSAPGEEREARETLRLAVEEMQERAVSRQDVAVLLRSPEMYGDAFADDLAALGLTPYIEAPTPLASSRAGRCMRALVRAVESDFGRLEVMEFLELADLEVDGGAAPLAAWNRATSLAGITSGADRWMTSLRALERSLERGRRDDDGRRDLLGPARSLLELLGNILPPLQALIAGRAPLGPQLDALIGVYERVRTDPGESGAVLEAVEGLRRLEPFAGDVTFAALAELIRSALRSSARRGVRFGAGGPNVLSLMGARGLSFRTVIVPGLVEKAFPLPRRQDPILLDAERAALNGVRDDDGFLPLRADSGSEEELLFRIAVGSAEETLILSFPRLDVAKGRPRIPSVFLLDALDELTGERHDYEAFDRSRHVTRVPLSRRFPDRRERALTEEEFDGCTVLQAMEGDNEEAAYVLAEHPVRRRGAAMEVARWGASHFTEYDGAVTSEEARIAVSDLSGIGPEGTLPGRAVSATALEEYAACPFQYLMHHVLGIAREEGPEEATELSPLDRGNLYHDVLESLLRGMRERGELPLEARDASRLRQAIREAANGAGTDLPGYRAARDLELEELETRLGLWLAWELRENASHEPYLFEKSFGEPRDAGENVRVVMESGGRSASFAGRIDRIDRARGGGPAHVIDYKTGKAPTGKASTGLRHGTRLQLPIYMYGGDAILGEVGSVGRALYLHLREPGGPTAVEFTREDLQEKQDDLWFAVGLILKGIEEGMLFPWPQGGRCRHCHYERACGVIALPLAMMKRGDPRASHFVSGLAEIE